MDKLKRVKVDTPLGVKYLTFSPVSEIPTDELICTKYCSYHEVCGKLPHPSDPTNEDLSFTDFCNDLGEKEGDEDLALTFPCKGELENLFKDDKSILQIIVGKNPIYRLTDIIDSCCPGMCELYNKEHSKCTERNRMCIFSSLLIKSPLKNEKTENDNIK